jgi:hypothetical protein
MKKDSANSSQSSIVSKSSEGRRPAAASPFGYARVHCLEREKGAVENQVFEMGPRIRSSSLDRRDNFERGHWLDKENAVNEGMPWSKPKEQDEALLSKARRYVLHHERMEAEQDLEWVPKQAVRNKKDEDARSHARTNTYANEVRHAAQTLEMAPMVQVCGLEQAKRAAAAVGPQYHGRRNILVRETAEESVEAVIASGVVDDGVPFHGRKNMLPPYVPNRPPVAAH